MPRVPPAPYLFLIILEALSALVKCKVDLGLVKGIELPFGKPKVLLQYADDTSFTLLSERDSMNCLIDTLGVFSLAEGLNLN